MVLSFLLINVNMICICHVFTFNIFVYLDIKCISYRQKIIECCFLFDLLGLLIRIFRPCTHDVIIDMVRLKSIILLLAFYLFHLFSVPLSSFSVLFWINWIFLQFYFISFVNLLAVTLCFMLVVALVFILNIFYKLQSTFKLYYTTSCVI